MINGKYLDSEQTVFNDKSIVGFSSIHDSRELVSMPELCRSSLMDQIDYDLDHYKINESSMYSYSIDQSNNMQNKQFVRAKAQLEVIEDINPKFMNFLNDGQKVLRPSNSSQNSINSQNCESANCNKKPKESNHQNISYKMDKQKKLNKIEIVDARVRDYPKTDQRTKENEDCRNKQGRHQFQTFEKVESVKISKPRY